MQNCKQCKYRLSSYGTNFYCCNKQQPVCSSCRLNACKICKQRRLNILQSPKCMLCWGRIYDGKAFTDKNCGKHFCSKCLVKTFKIAYQNTLAPSRYRTLQDQLSFKLPCGDSCHFSEMLSFFKDYCAQCGKDYRETLDFDLKDGLKLCFMCESCFRDKYSNAFIKCNICGCSIEKKSKAGISNQQDLILCKNCFFESQVEEKYIQKNKQLNESRKKSESFQRERQSIKTEEKTYEDHKKRPESNVDTFFNQQKSSTTFLEKKFQQSFSETKTQRVFNQKKSQQHIKEFKEQKVLHQKNAQQVNQEKKLAKKQESQVSSLRKIIEKTWKSLPEKDSVKEQEKYEEKDNKRSKPKSQEKVESFQTETEKISLPKHEKLETVKHQQGSNEYFVTHELINEEEQVDDEVKKQLGIKDGLVLKKYLSDETLVQNLTLEIPSIDTNTYVKCKQCNIKLPIKLAYNMDSKSQNKPKSSSLLCVSSIEESLSRSRTKDSKYSCRVCYQKITDTMSKSKRKPIFDQSTSTIDRSFMTNSSHRSVLEDSRRISDQMRDSYVSHRKDLGQSTKKPYVSPYGLTGARLQQHRTITQNHKNTLNQSIRRPSTSIKPSHEKIRLTVNELKPQRRTNQRYVTEKCLYCGLHCEGLVYSLDGGRYCKGCYAKKNRLLYSDYAYLKNIY